MRRNKDFATTFPGPLADWFASIDAEVPSKQDILTGAKTSFIIDIDVDDPATTKEYDGGDDIHEKTVPGWNTDTDTLGG